jgi:hypothetical protein
VSPILESIGSVKGFGWGALAAGGSFESISTVTVGAGGASTVTFSSIPSTYTHLQIRILSRDSRVSTNSDSTMRFNADTAANYSEHNISGDGGTVFVGAGTSVTNMNIGNQPGLNTTASVFGSRVIDILDYANTNKYKTMRCLSGYDANGSGWVMLSSGSWRNTAAITSITFTPLVAPYVQYSSFNLYGIKGA